LGGEHPEVADSYNDIGDVYTEQGQYEEALIQLEKSLEIRLRVWGSEDAHVTGSYTSIGNVYKEQGKLERL